MTYQQALSHITAISKPGICLGLDNISAAARACGCPEVAFEAIHIAGTNGKGSTATMIATALTACGYKVGLYTSPAVISLRDTIQIDGRPISEEEFAQLTVDISEALPCALSEFEFITILAFCWFRDNNIDIAVIECGMGGATDATNILPAPLCAVFTPIDTDHNAFLGSSIAEIAAQKSGIIKPPCDIICAPQMHEDALGVIFEKAAETGLCVHIPSPPSSVRYDANAVVFSYEDTIVSLSLRGDHQADNAVTALTVLRCLQKRGKHIDIQQAIAALNTVRMPCRTEIIKTDPTVIIDGAHNPHGIRALCQTVTAYTDEPIVLVIGMLKDKDQHTCLQQLSPLCKQIICCTPPFPERALPASELATIARQYHDNVCAIEEPFAAFQYAKKAADQTPIVVGGSFYTSSAIRQHLTDK